MLLLPALTLLDDTTALRQAQGPQAQGPRAQEPQAQHSVQGDALEWTTTRNKKQETLLDYPSASLRHSNRSDFQPGTSTTLRQAQCPAQ